MPFSGMLADVGQEWDFDVRIEVLREQRRASKDARRFKIAVAVLMGISIGVATLGAYGLVYGSFSAVSGFWTAAGPILGTIVGYYFGKDGDDP